MADQRGRCTNVEFCTVAVSQKAIAVPPGEAFVCPKCNEPLQSVEERRSRPRKAVAFALQAVVLVIAGGAIAWRVYAPRTEAPVAVAAAPSTPGQTIVSGASFTASDPLPVAAPPAEAQARFPTPPPVLAMAVPPPAPPTRVQAPTILLRLAAPVALNTGLERRLASGYLSLIGDTGITAEAQGNDTDVIGLQAGAREGIRIVPASSEAAFAALLRGTADIAISLRRVKPAEAERLATIGDVTSPANEHVIGVQGIAVIVSPANRVPSLTTGQVRDVLTGRITDWADLGGPPRPRPRPRPGRGDSHVDTPQDLVLGDTPVIASAMRDATLAALAAAVATDRAALGLVVATAAGSARIVPLSEVGAVPVMPTDLAVATEDYPLTRPRLLLPRPRRRHRLRPPLLRLRRLPHRPGRGRGRRLRRPQPPHRRRLRPEAATDRYKQFVAGTSRVSVDFRFQPGSIELDGRGVRDVERLVAFVRTRKVPPGRLMLAAFADNSGTPAVNQLTSQRRAEAVAAALARQGMQVGKVAGFGAEFPIADNATVDGRERNRRVEVYLAP